MAVDKEGLLDLLEKFIDRSSRNIKDAEKREDIDDIFYYRGQKDVIEELKDMTSKW